MCYDQPRHAILKTTAPVTVRLVLNGKVVMERAPGEAKAAAERETKAFGVQMLRLKACEAMDTAASLSTSSDSAAIAAPLSGILAEIRGSALANEDAVKRLGNTIESECLMGAEAENFKKWGSHYMRTLPCMLRAERRSNFRDECMQHFGHDARNREGIFEEQSNAAEMRFATLAPPEPSLLRPQPEPTTTFGGVPMPMMAS